MASILFIHQSFPAQFIHLAKALVSTGAHSVMSSGIDGQSHGLDGTRHEPYPLLQRPSANGLSLLSDIEMKLVRAASLYQHALRLKQSGLQPHLVIAHSGWGEPLFVKEVWPEAKLLLYQEYYYNSRGSDHDFDPEFPPRSHSGLHALCKNSTQLLALQLADKCYTPTYFQKGLIPAEYQGKTSVIHDGIDTVFAAPIKGRQRALSIRNLSLDLSAVKLVTYVSRTLEPMRGFHSLMRCLPHLMAHDPQIHVVVVGSKRGGGYGGKRSDGLTWFDVLSQEIGLDAMPWKDRVHFTGELPQPDYLQLLQHSQCHVYLTYPFVLSWSLLEAMSVGCPIVASDTQPVQEVIQNGINGRLVDFFDYQALAASVIEILESPAEAAEMGRSARNSIEQNYSLKACIPKQMALITSLLPENDDT